MAREIKPDGDIRFEGFYSYPNSVAFPADGGVLEYTENMELNEGVATPRLGSTLAGSASAPITYACGASSSTGDSILLWGTNQRFNCQTGAFTSVNLAAKVKARGQGYQDALTMETTDNDFVAGANIVERLVTAKGDKINFTLYTGVQPYEPDSAYLIQGTYDEVQAIIPDVNAMLVLGKRSIYSVEGGLGRQANIERKVSPQVFHRINKVAHQEGLATPDAICKIGSTVLFMDSNGIKGLKYSGGKIGYEEGTPPITLTIQDIMDLIDQTKLAEITAVSCHGRCFFTLPLNGQYAKSVILVFNTFNKVPLESVYVYPYSINTVVVGRRDGKPRLWGINKALGKVYLLNEGSTDGGTAVVAKMRSRNYFFGSHSDKKYDDCFMTLDTKGQAEVEMNFISVNPDGKTLMDKFNGNLGTAVRRALANKKCMGGKIEVVVKAGRPAIYSVGVEASFVGKSIFSSF